MSQTPDLNIGGEGSAGDELSALFESETLIENPGPAQIIAPESASADVLTPHPKREVKSSSTTPTVRGQRPAVIDLSGRGLNSRKLMTEQGAIPLKKASRLPGKELGKLIASGEISEDDAACVLDALHKNHTIFVSDDLQSLTTILDAARADMQSSSTTYPIISMPLNLKSLTETIFQVLSSKDAHIAVGTSSQGDPVRDLHRLLLLSGSDLALEDLRQMLLPGVALALHRSKPRLRQLLPVVPEADLG